MSTVSKDFWVSNEHLDKINKSEEVAIIIRNKDESCFSDSVINKAINKITITYEIDREVTINESEFDRLFPPRLGFFERDLQIIKNKLFGGGENE